MTEIENKHQVEVAELNRLELHLIELISEIDNDILRDKFLEWQQQRSICNSVYNDWLAETLKKVSVGK